MFVNFYTYFTLIVTLLPNLQKNNKLVLVFSPKQREKREEQIIINLPFLLYITIKNI